MSHKIPEAEAVELMLAKNLRPLESYPGRAKPWRCECLICKHIVTPRLASIRLGQGGCVYCAGKATISEEEAREILKGASLRPLEPYKGSRIGWKSECVNCGRVSTPRVDTVKNRGAKCRFCSAKERGKKSRMSQDEARELARNANLEPLEPYVTSQTKWKCKCLKCHSIVFPMATSLQSGQGGCKKCGNLATKEKQLHPESEAVEFFESRGFRPLVAYPGANRPWKLSI